MGARIEYFSDAGKVSMFLVKHEDLVKAFKTITLMEQQRIDNIKAEETSLEKAKELIEKESDKKKASP